MHGQGYRGHSRGPASRRWGWRKAGRRLVLGLIGQTSHRIGPEGLLGVGSLVNWWGGLPGWRASIRMASQPLSRTSGLAFAEFLGKAGAMITPLWGATGVSISTAPQTWTIFSRVTKDMPEIGVCADGAGLALVLLLSGRP